MQGGGIFSRYYIPDTATQAYLLVLFYLLINQIYVPHTNVVCKEGLLKRKIWEHKI